MLSRDRRDERLEERLPVREDEAEREQPGAESHERPPTDVEREGVERESVQEPSPSSGEESIPTKHEIDEKRQAG